jgi:transcriptional regulator with XRE-family HTH domain
MALGKKQLSTAFLLRKRLGLNQSEFWTRLGVTQSGGSRYESDRRFPRPVQILIELAYGNKPLQALKRLRRRK